MHRLFGRSKPDSAPAAASDEPSPSLADTLAKGDSRITDLENKINACNVQLKELHGQLSHARGAPAQRSLRMRMKNILQRRKLLENQLNMAYNTSAGLQQASFALETTSMVQEQMAVTKAAVGQLKAQHQLLDLDAMDDVQADMAELLADAADISDLMSRPYGLPDEVDDMDLDAELAALGDQFESAEPASAAAQPASGFADMDFGTSYLADLAGSSTAAPAAAPAAAATSYSQPVPAMPSAPHSSASATALQMP